MWLRVNKQPFLWDSCLLPPQPPSAGLSVPVARLRGPARSTPVVAVGSAAGAACHQGWQRAGLKQQTNKKHAWLGYACTLETEISCSESRIPARQQSREERAARLPCTGQGADSPSRCQLPPLGAQRGSLPSCKQECPAMLRLLALLYSTQLQPWDTGTSGRVGEHSSIPSHCSQPSQRPREQAHTMTAAKRRAVNN